MDEMLAVKVTISDSLMKSHLPNISEQAPYKQRNVKCCNSLSEQELNPGVEFTKKYHVFFKNLLFCLANN